MLWEFNPNIPIYLQLIDKIKLGMITGIYPPGSKIPSVRDLAYDAGVNPNTMQKALSELERDNLLFSQRTSGRYVTEDVEMLENLKQDLAEKQMQRFFLAMEELGISREQIPALINKALQKQPLPETVKEMN